MRFHLKNFFFTLVVFRSVGICTTSEYRVHVDGLSQEANCTVAVYISLPSAIYVNVNEIADLKRIGKTLACSEGEIDVELFAEKAKPQSVTICGKLKPSGTILSLPMHQRYKFSRENGGHVAVDIPQPKILLGCQKRLEDHRVSKIDLCSPCVDSAVKWREIPYKTKSEDIVWLIPVGNVSNLAEVSVITLLVTCIGAAAVLQALLRLRIGDETAAR